MKITKQRMIVAHNKMMYVQNARDITISTHNNMLCEHNKMESAYDILISPHTKMPCTHNGIQNV